LTVEEIDILVQGLMVYRAAIRGGEVYYPPADTPEQQEWREEKIIIIESILIKAAADRPERVRWESLQKDAGQHNNNYCE
jgi:hypothetical protein